MITKYFFLVIQKNYFLKLPQIAFVLRLSANSPIVTMRTWYFKHLTYLSFLKDCVISKNLSSYLTHWMENEEKLVSRIFAQMLSVKILNLDLYKFFSPNQNYTEHIVHTSRHDKWLSLLFYMKS